MLKISPDLQPLNSTGTWGRGGGFLLIIYIKLTFSGLKHTLNISKLQTPHPEGKLLSQDIAADAVRLRSARLSILHNHSARQACQTTREHSNFRHVAFLFFQF